ncbi:MAG: alpha-mannosidase [Clostridia bacterium]|nr:alpha-mannosidase [Clostridia bacterium]
MANKRVHLICNAHIDPVWQWNWAEGVGAAISTYRTAARFCKEFGGFVFNHNEALLYEWIEEYDPVLFADIKELVKQGKWNVMGGWYLQPDCNMPSGEAFVRQIELGHRYFQEKFGVSGFNTAINFDPFGHTAGLVQILNKAGYKNYIVTRPAKLSSNPDVNINDQVINWEGFCDSHVSVFKANRYCTNLGKAATHLETFLDNQSDRNEVICALWGVGNHGGGPSERDYRELNAYCAEHGYEAIHSTPDRFFEDFAAHEKPAFTHRGSLQQFAVGCYTSMARIKQANRRLENKLLLAEKLCSTTLANGITDSFPEEKLNDAWKSLAFLQFHDSLPGSSIQSVENDALQCADHGLEIADKLATKAYFDCCNGQTPPKGKELPILVYNPHPYTLKTLVECEHMLEDQSTEEGDFSYAEVYDDQGNKLPAQNEKESSNIPMDWAKKVVFEAELAPMSVSRFNIIPVRIDHFPREPFACEGDDFVFDNGTMRVVISKNDGLMHSYCVNGVEYLKGEAAKLLVVADDCDPWGMLVDRFRDVIGEFKLADARRTAEVCCVPEGEIKPIRVVENGPVRTIIEATFVYKDSALNMRYTLPKKGAQIGVNLRVFSLEREVMLKWSVPTVLDGGEYIGKTAYGQDTLPTDGAECVAQDWVMLRKDGKALSVINTGTYGSDCADGEIRMSLLRTAGYCAHPYRGRQILMHDRLTPHIDIGERLFDFYIEAGSADEIRSKVDSQAAEKHQPPMPLCYFPPLAGEKAKPLCVVENRTMTLVTAKAARSGEGFIVRLHNAVETDNTAEVAFPVFGTKTTVSAKPFEIVTLYVDKNGNAAPTSMLDI